MHWRIKIIFSCCVTKRCRPSYFTEEELDAYLSQGHVTFACPAVVEDGDEINSGFDFCGAPILAGVLAFIDIA